MSDTNDEELFRLEMGDVQPIASDKRIHLNASQNALKNSARLSPGVKKRRLAAQAIVEADNNRLSGEYVERIDPQEILSFQSPGVQHGVFKKLRLGKYRIDAQLDLHRMNVEQARREVFQFLQDCLEYGIRCALIVHGLGEGRQPQPGLLKSCVAHWLPQLDSVLAFHSAQKRDGGAGATYVLLRKGERERQKNREMHMEKRR